LSAYKARLLRNVAEESGSRGLELELGVAVVDVNAFVDSVDRGMVLGSKVFVRVGFVVLVSGETSDLVGSGVRDERGASEEEPSPDPEGGVGKGLNSKETLRDTGGGEIGGMDVGKDMGKGISVRGRVIVW